MQEKINYRPCYIDGKKAIFHQWSNGVYKVRKNFGFDYYPFTYGIVEFENGEIGGAKPSEVQFADNIKFNDYEWNEITVEDGSEKICNNGNKVRAKWIYQRNIDTDDIGYKCSACDGPLWLSPDVPKSFRFCPSCGKEMEIF